LVGDADIRHIAGGETGEFAIMIGNRDLQGRGLGMRFAVMMHAFAFRRLGLRRVHVSIIPDNAPSRRLFEKLGYEHDDRPEARAFADNQTDLTMSLDCDRFELAMAQELTEIQIRERPHPGPASRP
jgi:RimJ/RimL family protein N-acetyltransferase